MKRKLKNLLGFVLGFFPTRLPTGMTEFREWADSFHDIYPLPTADIDSIRYTLATAIIGLGSTTAYKPKFYFFLLIRAGAAKQIAGGIFTEIRQKQKEREAAAKAAEEAAIVAN